MFSLTIVCGLHFRVCQFAEFCSLGHNTGTEIIRSLQSGADEGGKTTNNSENNKINLKYIHASQK